ncbi:hypothetical protein [Corynebacterium jeddahense]|uniref:hypothetical protein n=1 Tax=Corynebacterium jeddahense TaxID=1414719 RepID=UPI0005AB758D|nr:hypothetical protein [Corynebacterium jeddahense]
MTDQVFTGLQQQALETYLDESLDPVLEVLETMEDQRLKDSARMAAALEAMDELENRISSIAASETELNTLSEQQQKLDKQLKKLAQTTVGTKEYDQAQKAVAQTISSLVSMLADIGPAMRNIQKTLGDLAVMYRATLEVSKHPVRLSDESATSVSRGLTRQLTTSLSSDIRPVVNESFRRVQADIDNTVNAAVSRLEKERARLSKALEKVSTERLELAEAIEKDTARIDNTKRFALWSVLAALLASVGFVAIGGLGVGVMTFLGIPDGLGTLWSYVAGAETWYGTVGWLIVTLAVMGLIVSPMVYLAAKWIGGRD